MVSEPVPPDHSGIERLDPRHHAREVAVQMLYQWEVGHASVQEVAAHFFEDRDALGQGDEGHEEEQPVPLSAAQRVKSRGCRQARTASGSTP